MRVQLTLSTPTMRWNCICLHIQKPDLKRFDIFKNIPSNCRPQFSDLLFCMYCIISLFLFVSVFYTFVWLLKLCTILGSLVHISENGSDFWNRIETLRVLKYKHYDVTKIFRALITCTYILVKYIYCGLSLLSVTLLLDFNVECWTRCEMAWWW